MVEALLTRPPRAAAPRPARAGRTTPPRRLGPWIALVPQAVSPPVTLEAGAARQRLQELTRLGWSSTVISQSTRIPLPVLHQLATGHEGHLSFEHEDRLWRFRADLGRVEAHLWVPATGTRRRLQALAVMGWGVAALSRQLGATPGQVRYWTRCGGHVQAGAAHRVAGLYEQIALRRGPSQRVRAQALQQGWPGPLEWDEDSIDGLIEPEPTIEDHPEEPDEIAVARAAAWERLALTRAEQNRLIGQLARVGTPDGQIAARLGVCQQTVHRRRLRLGIPPGVPARGGRKRTP